MSTTIFAPDFPAVGGNVFNRLGIDMETDRKAFMIGRVQYEHNKDFMDLDGFGYCRKTL
jgi:hypothetical protein